MVQKYHQTEQEHVTKAVDKLQQEVWDNYLFVKMHLLFT